MIDVDHQISSVSRSLGRRTLAAGEARVMTISQTYKSDVADVWDALTNPERLPGGSCRSAARWRSAGATSSKATRAGSWSAATPRTRSPPPGSSATR